MKLLFITLFIILSLLAIQSEVFAAVTPTPTVTPQVQFTNEFTTDNDPNGIVSILKSFIYGFDSILGGFIFYTPDPLSNKIILEDMSEIPGVTQYRNMFYEIAIPLLAIVIAVISLSKIGSDNTQELKSFAFRFLITIVLFISVPPILSYSIQFNNLLVNKITKIQQFTAFLNDYLEKADVQIKQGEDPEQFGIPHFEFSLVGGALKFLGQLVVKLFLFAITFIFLLLGLLYIGFQFVIRFASLVFLGVIFPVVIPFMLSEKTQNIVYMYFKSWFTFLIMQPAFVLGFAITTDIFTNILNAKGPSIGLLFFYTGFLFFLGGVNMLVGRIFGDVWGVMATNMQAHVASRSVMHPTQSSFRDFKRGLMGTNSISNTVGQKTHQKIVSIFHKDDETTPLRPGSGSGNKTETSTDPTHDVSNQTFQNAIPSFSQELQGRGLQVKMVNQKQGIVSVSGEAYQNSDQKTGLTSVYPSRFEAVQDGVSEEKIDRVHLDRAQFIDLSTFDKHNPNPHNYNAMQEARKQGKKLHFAYVDPYSPQSRVKNFLEMSKARNEALGVKGVIVRRQGTQSSDQIIRLYTKNEKRQNI